MKQIKHTCWVLPKYKMLLLVPYKNGISTMREQFGSPFETVDFSLYPRYEKAMIVRDPIVRTISAYNNFFVHTNNNHPLNVFKNVFSDEDFIKYCSNRGKHLANVNDLNYFINSYIDKVKDIDNHFSKQSTVLEQHNITADDIDIFFSTEKFYEFENYLKLTKSFKENQTTYTYYSNYSSPIKLLEKNTINLLKKIYRDDFDLYKNVKA